MIRRQFLTGLCAVLAMPTLALPQTALPIPPPIPPEAWAHAMVMIGGDDPDDIGDGWDLVEDLIHWNDPDRVRVRELCRELDELAASWPPHLPRPLVLGGAVA